LELFLAKQCATNENASLELLRGLLMQEVFGRLRQKLDDSGEAMKQVKTESTRGPL
jgi:hypothetical protein